MSPGKPHLALDDLYNKYGKIYSIKFGSVFTVILSEPEVINEAFLKNSTAFINRYMTPSYEIVGGNRNIGFTNGVHWKKIRGFVNNSFKKSKIRQLETLMNYEYSRMTDALDLEIKKSNNIFCIRPLLKRLSFNIIFNFLFSSNIPYTDCDLSEDAKKYVDNAVALLGKLAGGSPADFIPLLKPFYGNSKLQEIQDLVDQLVAYSKPFIIQHQNTLDENKDFIDLLLIEIKNDPDKFASEDCIQRIALDLLVGGMDTTSSSLEWIILFLSNYPEFQDKLFIELNTNFRELGRDPSTPEKGKFPLMNAIIKESWRRMPTVPLGIPHECSEDTEISGFVIPKGAQVVTNIYTASLNPKLWDDPLTFDPMRFVARPNSLPLIFSTGPRKCPGMDLASEELFLAATKIFRQYKFERPTENLLDETPIMGITLEPTKYNSKITKRQ
eukprot:gene3774-4698_t